MSSFEWNKIIGSILAAILIAQVAAILGGLLVKPRELEKPVFTVPIPTEVAASQAPKAAGPPPIGLRLAAADPKKGEEEAQVCTACHTFTKGGANGIGPNLWDVAGTAMGEDRNGFDFSSAMEKTKKGTKLTPQILDVWLTDPQAFIPGTKMTFAGIPNPEQRANVIAFLETLTPGGLAAEKKLAKKLAAETPKPAAAAPAKPAGPTFAALFAKADPAKGKEEAQICTACHTFTKGGPNAIGPNLWDIVGKPMGEDHNGYAFSEAVEKKKGTKLTPEMLNVWLTDPQKFAPGTKMTFAGFPSEKTRADVIAYLATLSPGGLAAEKELAKKLAAEAPKPAAAATPAKPAGPTFADLLAKADAKKGEQDAQICSACHTFTKGGPNAIGPNLWGIVGKPMGEDHQGYAFSEAVEKKKGTKLTPEVLNVWLTDPQKFAPGTKMTFAGFPSEKERADVIKYLETLK